MRNHRSTIIGFITLIVLLSAGAAQSLSGSNTVDSGDIKAGQIMNSDLATNAVTSSKIKAGEVKGSDIADNVVTGSDVNESTLTPTCPSGMLPARDVCYGSAAATGTFLVAAVACNDAGLRLPSLGEALLVADAIGGDLLYWTDSRSSDNAGSTANAVGAAGPGSGGLSSDSNVSYRCVTTIGARP